MFNKIMFKSFISKIGAFDMQKNPELNSRVTPFHKGLTSKAKTPYTIKAPSITPPSTGKSDTGKIE